MTHFNVRCTRAYGNLVSIRVNGEQVACEPEGGATVGRFRGVVRDIREAHPDATIALPVGLSNEMDLIRDWAILLGPVAI